MIPNVLIS